MRHTPTKTQKTVGLPATLPVTVRNIREAAETCHQYKSVLTAGPRYHEVSDFRHPDHKIVEFADSINADFGPSFEHVEEMVKWGETRDSILVHCHAGISRSTATAWGISIAQGVNPVVALDALVENHPQNYHPYVPEYSGGGYPYQREFSPNPQLVRHLEVLFGYDKDHLIGLLYDKGIHVRQSL